MRLLYVWALNMSILTVLVIGSFVVGPDLETRYWPVFSKFRIDSVRDIGEGHTEVAVTFTKFRDCAPQGYAWYTGDLDTNYRQLEVVNQRRSSSSMLPIGRHNSVFIIDIPPEDFARGVYAEVFSRCHPFWTTRSVVYP